YAVLSFGGVFGLGEKSVALPLSALKPAAEAKTFVLEMDPERLRTAPEFNQDNWPQVTDPQWIKSVYTFYGLQPYWQPYQPMVFVSYSPLKEHRTSGLQVFDTAERSQVGLPGASDLQCTVSAHYLLINEFARQKERG